MTQLEVTKLSTLPDKPEGLDAAESSSDPFGANVEESKQAKMGGDDLDFLADSAPAATSTIPAF